MVTTREPGAPVGEAVYDILLSPVHTEMAPDRALLAPPLGRSWWKVVRPALSVVPWSDHRYLDSSSPIRASVGSWAWMTSL